MKCLLFLFCLIVLCKGNKPNGLKLQQVFVVSRHNIRTPIATNLDGYTPNQWPKFNNSDGELTSKGALMESYMAEYFADWLASEDFIKGCPKQEEVLIYSNSLSRTKDTAKSFAEGAFRSCNITIRHKDRLDVFDPVFHSIFHNNSENYVQKMINEMERTLNNTDLTESYLAVNKILDIENSDICKHKNVCDLSKNKTQIFYEKGQENNVQGPLLFSGQVVDAFLMSFYEGFPLEKVAWGKITTDKQWELLIRIIKLNLKVRYSKSASKDMGKPLLEYMFNIFRSGNPKFTVLVGHDSNIRIILNALGFKKFNVENQFEPYPIGGKLVFQKWSDGANSFLKLEYVYPTFLQLRNGVRLSMAHPPQRVLLELKDCKMNDSGYCPWEDFVHLFL